LSIEESTQAMNTESSSWPEWSTPAAHLEPGSGAPAVAQALAWLEDQGTQRGWPGKAMFALTLCADEAMVNTTSYAQRPDGQPAHLYLSCGDTPGGIALCIEDDGVPFDPTQQESPTLAVSLDDAHVGGHGLRLMRHYLRHMLYRRAGERNVLLLEVGL
jgi:serine/threonine-protein kinase RsbW